MFDLNTLLPLTNLTATGVVPESYPLIPSASAFITIPKAPEPRTFCNTSFSLWNSHLFDAVRCVSSPPAEPVAIDKRSPLCGK